ncbi:Bifunctional protein PaaZ [Stieleria neptunia]|uniref:Bifunctional protein PaaZ n=1 Tax=Stieleria neptunia TaxID=2527979 RepID=A0A518HRQ0_9BACT|nr:MaoC/PaaZ C-terminal domain-containing protein [Stieleria neptunia]QDV43517.1 Bifunctional protein PaaZ [Stieleria neptunia]
MPESTANPRDAQPASFRIDSEPTKSVSAETPETVHLVSPPPAIESLPSAIESPPPAIESLPAAIKSLPAAIESLPPADPTLYAEDLAVGDVWQTEMRQITDSDVQAFADLTGDHTPLHGDQGSGSPYGKPIAHGLLGLSVLAGLGTNHPKASTLAFVAVEDWRFVAPVFFGDRVQARNEIVEIEPHGRRAVKVRWLRQLLDETGRVTQEGYFVTLVGSKARGRKKPR